MRPVWRGARPDEDELIVEMCAELNREDPGPEPVPREQMRHTLSVLRREPFRGRAAVLEVDGKVVGYALLIAYWSNEHGGEIAAIDELYVSPRYRGRGVAGALFDAVLVDRALWPRRPVALELEVTPANARARAYYERLGFRAGNATLRRRVERSQPGARDES